MATQSESAFSGQTFEQRLHMAMWNARLTPPKLGALVGVSGQTIRNWQDPDHPARPGNSDVLAYAISTNVPVEALDPNHPQAGLRWTYTAGPDGGDESGTGAIMRE